VQPIGVCIFLDFRIHLDKQLLQSLNINILLRLASLPMLDLTLTSTTDLK
jgi:hypothetical protein